MKNTVIRAVAMLLAAVAVLSACESPLNLQGVEASASGSIRRGDLFQDILGRLASDAAVDGIVSGRDRALDYRDVPTRGNGVHERFLRTGA